MSKWEMVELGEVAAITSGGTPKRNNKYYWDNGNIPWVKISDIKTKYIRNTEEKITETGLNNSSAKIFKKGTLLYTIFATIGEVGVLDIDAATNQAIAGITLERNINIDYAYFFLKSVKNRVDSIGRGVAQNNINLSILKKIRIPLPPIKVQREMANTLNIVIELLVMRKRQLVELDNLIKSTFYNMFGDPVTNEKGWEVGTVNKVCSKILGGGTPSKNNSEYYNGIIPWVTPKDMKTIWIKDSVDHINEEAVKNSSTNLIPANSVLMVIRSGILKKTLPVAINRVNATINQDMKAFITNELVKTEYLLYFFMFIQNYILKNVRSVTADNIEFSLIKNLTIPLPPIPLQNQFASIVAKIEEQKALVKKAIDETQLLFDSLMSEYFE